MPHSNNAGARRGSRGRHLHVGGAGLAAVATALATAASASAAGTIPTPTTLNQPPAGGVSVLVFPVRDFVSTAGFTADDRVTVNVIRDGVPIGTATDLVPQDDPKTPTVFDGIVEVNHPGGGCWETSTPDILPGDVVRTTVTANAADPSRVGIADETFTQDVSAGPATSAGGGTIVIHGFAKDALTADGRFPVGELESRLVANKDLFHANSRRTLRAATGSGVAGGDDGDISYDIAFNGNVADPANYAWTATYKNLDAADVTRALGAESRGMWLGRNPAALTENTVYENGQVGGPTAPCTAPATTTAITGTSVTAINASFSAASPPVTVSGIAEAAVTGGSVSVPGAAPHAMTLAPSGTWTATIPSSELVSLPDGPVTITAAFTGAPGIRTADSTTIAKDTAVPAPPVIDPGTGIFADTQLVHLDAEPGTTIRFTTSGAAPSVASPQFSADFLVTASRTIRAVAIDAAGNMSAPSAATLTIDRTAPVSAISAASAGGASLGTVTPATSATFVFGANELVQKFECRLDGGGWVPCASPKTYTGLGAGQHAFSVRATDLAGNLELSPPVWNWTVGTAGAQQPAPVTQPAQPPVQQIIVLPPVGGAGGGVQSALPARLRLAAVSAPRSVKLAAARKGVRVSMRVPTGATSVRLTLKRAGRTVSTRVVAAHAGATVLRVKVTRKGSYRLTLTPLGLSSGVAKTVAFTVR